MVEAQEVEPLRTPGEVRDPGLLGCNCNPSVPMVAATSSRSSACSLVAQRTTRSSAYLASTPSLSPLALPRLIEHVQRDVAEQR